MPCDCNKRQIQHEKSPVRVMGRETARSARSLNLYSSIETLEGVRYIARMMTILSSHLQNPHRKPGIRAPLTPSLGSKRTAPCQPCPRFRERPCLKGIGWRATVEDRHLMSVTCPWVYTHTHSHIYTLLKSSSP